MIKNKKIFICCTEQSGEVISSNILNRLRQNNNLTIDGVCGSFSKNYLRNKFFDISDFKSMGLFEVLLSIFKYIKILNFLSNKIIKINYDLIITIDSPDFNYQLAKKIRNKKFKNKIIHIVAPTVWAWRKGRAKKFANVYDEIFTLFEFENKYFNKHGLKTTFIGHPIYHIKSSNLKNKKKYIAFLPGSRKKEIIQLFKFYEIAYRFLLKNKKFQYDIFIPTLPHLEKLIIKNTKKWKIKTIISTDQKKIDEYFQNVHSSITCSGTASLEIAKRLIPQLIIYKFNFFTTLIAHNLVNVKYANLLNIFSNKMIIPELTNFNLNKKDFIYQFNLLLNDEIRNNDQINNIIQNLKYFDNNKSPYDICSDRINELL